ncbi:hypothetical protein [Gloeocapsopsis dulcis]|uniref:Uncharacterized protein n=1 Tax=Gloeocapsopsis dulcis AAB1 = 1H9 TaxID=1433147 RepID=A0A6N8FP90_9CHRO|nr:hypothetical protein [Gloeocapsopsis dulcis]MUL35168.1 hypothetical protein [Gloeocapsopsis dulcis AAB1 = 1H9]WNN89049.1 hypothetical protein P0S91_22810 [Gloeocapsopsis dulcis]
MSVSSTAEAKTILNKSNNSFTKENSLPGDRPITASTFKISDTVNILGIRPIAASELQVSDTLNLLGVRPIAASELQVYKTITTAGIRPIATNEVEKIDELIGYLD